MLLQILLLKIQAKVLYAKDRFVHFDRSFNLCAYKRVKFSNMFLKLMLVEIEKSIPNFSMKCPFKKENEVELLNKINSLNIDLLYFRIHTDIND